jgi:hypothetical protein
VDVIVENICPSHNLLMYIIFQCSFGASYKTFVILNSGNLDFVNFLPILRKFIHVKEKSKALYCFFMISADYATYEKYVETCLHVKEDYCVLTMIIIIAAVYGNEFVTSSKTI